MPATVHPKGFWTQGGEGYEYLIMIRDGTANFKQVAETLHVSDTAVHSAYNHYILGRKYPSELKKYNRGSNTRSRPQELDFADPSFKKLLNAVSEWAGSLIQVQISEAQNKISTLEKENQSLKTEVETLKGELTMQALAFKKLEHRHRENALRKAGVVPAD